MSGSTLIVAINALMLKRTKLAGIKQPGKSAAPDVAAQSSQTTKDSSAPASQQDKKKAVV